MDIIGNIDKNNQNVTIEFDKMGVVIHIYAITINKSQGSEYHTLVIHWSYINAPLYHAAT